MNIADLATRYIEPEAKRLIKEGRVPYGFRIRQAQVLLPNDRPPVISFNEGITWQMQMDTSQFEEGQAIYLHDLRKITGVAFPKHDGQKVAYIFLITQLAPRRARRGYRVVRKYQSRHGTQRDPVPERSLHV
jgi:hypothetical protein